MRMKAGCLSMDTGISCESLQTERNQLQVRKIFSSHSVPFVRCRRRHSLRIIFRCKADSDKKGGPRQHTGLGRREFALSSTQLLPLAALLSGTDDAKTIVNSVLGAYGLPKLPSSTGYKLYDDFDEEYVFEYPKSWVARSNHQRKGIYFSDFNTSDKAVLEEFQEPEEARSAITEIVSRAVSPASEIGGDARLILPDERRIKSEEVEHDGLKYIYVRFPSETVTRSGYQINRKNIAVAAAKHGRMFSLLASARSDQYNKDKEQMLQHIIQSFRVRP